MQTTLWRRIAISLGLMMALIAPSASQAQNGSPNDMIRGGITSTSDLISTLQNGDGVHSAKTLQADYAAVQVTPSNLRSYTAHNGYVTKTGQVVLSDSGKVVATNAFSYGRSDLGNSTKISNHLYKRSTAVSFAQSRLDALIYTTQNGSFKYAIVKDCGNVVTATPKTVSKATVQQPTPAPAPAPVINVVQTQVQTQTQTVTTPPAPAPTPAPAPLPQTGASAFGLALGCTGLLFAGLYYWRGRRDLRLAWSRVNS